MNNISKKISKKELSEMITTITKDVLNEVMENNMALGYSQDPLEQLMQLAMEGDLDSNQPDRNDWFGSENVNEDEINGSANVPSTSFGGDGVSLSESVVENDEKKKLQEKQDKLFNFITENWDHHANNLIK